MLKPFKSRQKKINEKQMEYIQLLGHRINFATNAEAIVAFKVICEGFGSPFHKKLIQVIEETQDLKAAWIAAHVEVATLNATMETEDYEYLQSQDFASLPTGVSSVSSERIYFSWTSRSAKDYILQLDLCDCESSLTVSYDPQSSMTELFEGLVSTIN
jgi:hypothetical protein